MFFNNVFFRGFQSQSSSFRINKIVFFHLRATGWQELRARLPQPASAARLQQLHAADPKLSLYI